MGASGRWSKAQLMVGRGRLVTPPHHQRSLLSRTLAGSSAYSSAYETVTGLLLFASIALAVAESVDPTRPRLYEAADGTLSTLFLLDYVARLYTATEHSRYRRLGWLHGRLAWMRSWEAVIDAVAALPFFVDVLLPFVEVPPLSWLRIFRVARIFHSSQHATAVRTASRG